MGRSGAWPFGHRLWGRFPGTTGSNALRSRNTRGGGKPYPRHVPPCRGLSRWGGCGNPPTITIHQGATTPGTGQKATCWVGAGRSRGEMGVAEIRISKRPHACPRSSGKKRPMAHAGGPPGGSQLNSGSLLIGFSGAVGALGKTRKSRAPRAPICWKRKILSWPRQNDVVPGLRGKISPRAPVGGFRQTSRKPGIFSPIRGRNAE